MIEKFITKAIARKNQSEIDFWKAKYLGYEIPFIGKEKAEENWNMFLTAAICPECKGTRVYIGLNKTENCKACKNEN